MTKAQLLFQVLLCFCNYDVIEGKNVFVEVSQVECGCKKEVLMA